MPLKVITEGNVQKELCVLSYSSYSTYKQCPKRYYREKIKREVLEKQDETYTIPGRIVHDSASYFFEKGSLDKFAEKYLMDTLNEYGKLETVNYDKAYGSFNKAYNLLKKSADNLKTFLLTRDKEKRYLSEQWFGTWNDPLKISENLALQGAPDLIELNSNGTAILYDFKTSWNTSNLSRDQLILYSIAVQYKWNIQATMCSFFLLPTNKQNYFTFTFDDKQLLLNNLQIAANRIITEKDALPETKNDKCKFCPFFDDCAANKVEKQVSQMKEGSVSFNFGADL